MVESIINFLKFLWEHVQTVFSMWGYLFHFSGNIVSAFSWLPQAFISILIMCLGWAVIMKIIGRDG